MTGYCTPPYGFGNVGATPDEAAGSCWTYGPHSNVWFSFVATGSDVTIDLKTGLGYGTLQYPLLALFDAGGTELACGLFVAANQIPAIASTALVPGQTYYIAVDCAPGGEGSFQLCINNAVDYDYQSAAIDLTGLSGCSPTTYTTVGGTADGIAPTCWPYGPTNNRWFRFEAAATDLSIELQPTSSGSIQYPLLAVLDTNGNTIACDVFTQSFQNLVVPVSGLNIGTPYYIVVDNAPGGAGSFNLCINSAADYDFQTSPIQLTDFNSWCSTPGAYTTQGASPDGPQPACWPYGPFRDRWFSFVAPSNSMQVVMRVRKGYGTLRYPMIAVYDDMLNEVGCHRFNNGYTQAVWVNSNSFVPGNTYYVQCDNAGGNNQAGTFTLCIDDLTSKTGNHEQLLLHEADAQAMLLFPNPAKTQVALRFLQPLEGSVNVLVSDVTGKLVKSTRLEAAANTQQLSINVQDLVPGVYVVSAQVAGQQYVQRLIVQ